MVSGPGAPIVRNLPGASFNERRQGFELTLTLETFGRIKTAANIDSEELARRCSPGLMGWARAARASEDRVAELHRMLAEGYLIDFEWADCNAGYDVFGRINEAQPPFQHQRVMATAAVTLDGCAFLCEMGTGKTRPAIEAMTWQVIQRTCEMHVVVAPKSVLHQWVTQIDRWQRGILEPVYLGGPIRERALRVRSPEEGEVFLVNYEALHNAEFFAALQSLCRNNKVGLVLDEMHKVRNPNTQQSKHAMALAQLANWRLGLTGTPILQGGHDIWAQWYVIDLGVTFGANFVQFRREFFQENPWTHEITSLPGTDSEIGIRLRRRGIRYRKADCMDLPPKLYEVQDVALTTEQQRAYRQMRDELITQLENGEHATAANQLTAILRLSQITSGFVNAENGLHRFEPNPKLTLCEEIVWEQVQEHSVIIWAWYNEDIDRLATTLHNLSPAIIRGGQSAAERARAQERFQDRSTRLMIANPASGGLGLDLYAADVAIYYSQSYSLEHRLQSEDRCHRAGSEQHERVTYIDLVCRGTVDEVVRNALAQKLDTAETIVDLRHHLGL